jgi:mannose/fructose/N-acetylgalactosamine-specific phosphotransferase system component IIC
MIMLCRVCILKTVFDPESLFSALAFGTVTTAATVIANMFSATMITTILMTAQGYGAAHGQGSKNAELVAVRIVFTAKILTEHPDYIRHFMLRAAHKASLYRVSRGL